MATTDGSFFRLIHIFFVRYNKINLFWMHSSFNGCTPSCYRLPNPTLCLVYSWSNTCFSIQFSHYVTSWLLLRFLSRWWFGHHISVVSKSIMWWISNNWLAISLEDFNLYVFHRIWWEFIDLVASLSTRTNPISYVNLHSHLLNHEFLHNISLQSMGVVVTASSLPTLTQPPSALVTHR